MKLGMWVVMGTSRSTTHVVYHHQMCIFNTSFAYLFWLANNKKVKYSEFCMGYMDETWYVGSGGHKYYPRGLSSPNAHIWYLICIIICSDWLITKGSNVQCFVWVTLMKLGMWVVMGTSRSTTHVAYHHQMRIFNTSFAYLFWLANNKKVKYSEFWMGYVDETWYVGSDKRKYYPCMWSIITKCTYLIPHLHICSD